MADLVREALDVYFAADELLPAGVDRVEAVREAVARAQKRSSPSGSAGSKARP